MIDSSLAKGDVIPFIVQYEDMEEDGRYENLRGLYELKKDVVPDTVSAVEFSLKLIAEIPSIKDYSKFSFSAGDKRGLINKNNIETYSLDKILFPKILRLERPCFLSSKDSYDIVRAYVKANINNAYATITSDYDFCLTVKKKILLNKAESYLADISRFGARKPKYETQYRDSREIEIFEMTHKDSNYKGYTPIEGFKGSNADDLDKNIKIYLDELMAKINAPLKDCECCKGRGVINEGIK